MEAPGEAAGSGLPTAAVPASGCVALYALKLDGAFANPWGPQVLPEERFGPEVQETLLNLESQLSKNPFNATAWNALLEVLDTPEAFDRALECLPTSVSLWRRKAECLFKRRQLSAAKATYHKALQAFPLVELWESYVKFVYCTGTFQEFACALTKAVEKISWDPRAGVLWRELLALYIRLYNSFLLQQGNTQGLLSFYRHVSGLLWLYESLGTLWERFVRWYVLPAMPPCKFFHRMRSKGAGASSISTTPLLFSDFERNNIRKTKEGVELLEKFSDLSVLRTAFQSCLRTAVDCLEGVWCTYCSFERSLTHSLTSAFHSKVISEFEDKYNAGKRTFKELSGFLKDVDFSLAAAPLSANDKHQQNQLRVWQSILSYEKQNPLQLPQPLFLKRLDEAFGTAVCGLGFAAEIWFDWCQVQLAHQKPARAVDVLRRAIDRFLPGDELLHLVLADFLEQRRMPKAADAVYRSALSASIRAGVETLAEGHVSGSFAGAVQDTYSGGAFSSVGGRVAGGEEASSVMLTRYLHFIRRTYGVAAWRSAFSICTRLRCIGWNVYTAQARGEWRMFANRENALNILRLAKCKFEASAAFIAEASDVLLEMALIDEARGLLRDGVISLSKEESGRGIKMLWKRWIRLETEYGDATSLRSALHLRAATRLGIDAETAVAFPDAVEGSGTPVGGAGQTGLLLAGASCMHGVLEEQVLCGVDLRTKGESIDSDDVARAKLAISMRQIMGGDSLHELHELYAVGSELPRTSMLGSVREAAGGPADSSPANDPSNVDSTVKSPDDEDGEGELAIAKGYHWGAVTPHRRMQVLRPDLGSFAIFEPDLAAMYHHEAASGAVNDPAAAAATAAAADIPVVAPPKLLCDLLMLLPKPTAKVVTNPELVDYLLTNLQTLRFRTLPSIDYKPLPVKDLLALKHAQLQCLHSRQRDFVSCTLDSPTSSDNSEDSSDVATDEDVSEGDGSLGRVDVAPPTAAAVAPGGQGYSTAGNASAEGVAAVAPVYQTQQQLLLHHDGMLRRGMLPPTAATTRATAMVPAVRPLWPGVSVVGAPLATPLAAPLGSAPLGGGPLGAPIAYNTPSVHPVQHGFMRMPLPVQDIRQTFQLWPVQDPSQGFR